MIEVNVDGSIFEFPDGWIVTKYDEWSFYRKQFVKLKAGVKAVDLIAIEPSGETAWLIEVKDYRVHPRTKTTDISEEMTLKVFDTLAALLPAKANANKNAEVEFARTALAVKRLRVVLHVAQQKQPSKLFARAINPADVSLKLRKCMKPVDPHPLVIDNTSNVQLAWVVR